MIGSDFLGTFSRFPLVTSYRCQAVFSHALDAPGGKPPRGLRFNGVQTRLGSILILRASTGTVPFRRTGTLGDE
jgi:hypothetical protein